MCLILPTLIDSFKRKKTQLLSPILKQTYRDFIFEQSNVEVARLSENSKVANR